MTEIPLPPALTRTAVPSAPWSGALLPPFAAGRTLPRMQFAARDDGLVFDELELDDVAIDDIALDDVATDDVGYDDVAVEEDAAVDEPATWEPDGWPDAEWTAEETAPAQPASEAAAFDAWVGDPDAAEPTAVDAGAAAAEADHDEALIDGAAAAKEQEGTAHGEAPDEVARLVAKRLDELAEQVRSRGLAGLGNPQDPDALSRLIAALVAGYVGRSD
jgi:hypothetical protein